MGYGYGGYGAGYGGAYGGYSGSYSSDNKARQKLSERFLRRLTVTVAQGLGLRCQFINLHFFLAVFKTLYKRPIDVSWEGK